MRILCDMDSIAADFYHGILDLYRDETGHHDIDPAIITTWDYVLPNGKDLYQYFSRPGFFRNLKPITGSLETLKQFQDDGHEVYIVTAATLTNAPGEKFEWLTQHAPWLNRRKVYFAADKHHIKGDIFIDDAPANARTYREHNPDALILGIEYPYHVTCEDRKPYDVLASNFLHFGRAWDQISSAVKEEQKRRDMTSLAVYNTDAAKAAARSLFSATPEQLAEAAVKAVK